MEMENVKRVVARRIANEGVADGARVADLEEQVQLQGLFIEQISREMDMMVEIMMTMDCKFEAVFEELDFLRSRNAGVRVRRSRLRRLGGPPPV